MATPNAAEMLTTEELLALEAAFDNPHFRTALVKIFAFDEKYHTETMRNAALAPVVNTNLIVAAASSSRYAFEAIETIKRRIQALTVRR